MNILSKYEECYLIKKYHHFQVLLLSPFEYKPSMSNIQLTMHNAYLNSKY